jgi:hypothetical protein
MTRHERLSLAISTAALVISIVSPFLNYYWFQNEVRVRQLKSEAFVVEANEYDCANFQTIVFDLELKNTGVWPIEHVQVNIQKVLVTFDPHRRGKDLRFVLNKKDIKPEPPLAIEIEEKAKAIARGCCSSGFVGRLSGASLAWRSAGWKGHGLWTPRGPVSVMRASFERNGRQA